MRFLIVVCLVVLVVAAFTMTECRQPVSPVIVEPEPQTEPLGTAPPDTSFGIEMRSVVSDTAYWELMP